MEEEKMKCDCYMNKGIRRQSVLERNWKSEMVRDEDGDWDEK